MPRVSEINEPGGDAAIAAEFAAEREMFGDVLNPSRVFAHCPPIWKAAKGLYASFPESARVPEALLALVYVRVATLNGCPF